MRNTLRICEKPKSTRIELREKYSYLVYNLNAYREHRFRLYNIKFVEEVLSHVERIRQHGVVGVAGRGVLYEVLEHRYN